MRDASAMAIPKAALPTLPASGISAREGGAPHAAGQRDQRAARRGHEQRGEIVLIVDDPRTAGAQRVDDRRGIGAVEPDRIADPMLESEHGADLDALVRLDEYDGVVSAGRVEHLGIDRTRRPGKVVGLREPDDKRGEFVLRGGRGTHRLQLRASSFFRSSAFSAINRSRSDATAGAASSRGRATGAVMPTASEYFR